MRSTVVTAVPPPPRRPNPARVATSRDSRLRRPVATSSVSYPECWTARHGTGVPLTVRAHCRRGRHREGSETVLIERLTGERQRRAAGRVTTGLPNVTAAGEGRRTWFTMTDDLSGESKATVALALVTPFPCARTLPIEPLDHAVSATSTS